MVLLDECTNLANVLCLNNLCEDTCVSPQNPQPDTTAYLVGKTNGEVTVGELGEAEYSTPLKLPPGIGTLTPTLSLAYSSSSRTPGGLIGIGWSISGVSEIHRCPGWNISEYNRGILFNENDNLCLDGAQFVKIN